MREKIETILIVMVIFLFIAGFIYNYSIDSNSTQDDCVPDYLTGDCFI